MRSWKSGNPTGRPSPGTSRSRGDAEAMTALDDPDLVLRFWKPYGCLTAFTDRDGRQTLADYINVPCVYPAGRGLARAGMASFGMSFICLMLPCNPFR